MRKVTGNRLQVTVIIATFILLFLLPTACCLPPVRAADSTPSADVKSKLEELKKEIASKANALKQEVNKKLTNKAYVGIIKTKSTNSITLASSVGPKIVSINQDSEFTRKLKGKVKITLEGLKEEDTIAALGDIDEIGVLTAKRIVLLPTINSKKHISPSEVKTHLWGQIVTLSDKLITLKLKDSKTISVSLPKGEEVKLNNFLIILGIVNENRVFEADFVYIIH